VQIRPVKEDLIRLATTMEVIKMTILSVEMMRSASALSTKLTS
jgi:hypothetical protein